MERASRGDPTAGPEVRGGNHCGLDAKQTRRRDAMTLASELATYIETLTISQGRHAGQRFHLLPWQKSDGCAGRSGTGVMDAALSLWLAASGKTTFTVAAIAAATVDVDGPLVQQRAENVVVASHHSARPRSLSTTCSHSCSRLLPSMGAVLKVRFRVNDTVNSAIHSRIPVTGASLKCIGSDRGRELMGNRTCVDFGG